MDLLFFSSRTAPLPLCQSPRIVVFFFFYLCQEHVYKAHDTGRGGGCSYSAKLHIVFYYRHCGHHLNYMKVGIAGLGLMGSGITKRLINSGHLVLIYNRTHSKTQHFSNKATVALSPRELAEGCDLLITVVTDFDAVKDILFGTDGVVESGNHNLVVADASTISPSQSEHCVQRLRSAGIEMLGIPIMGGPAAAEAGELIHIVSGNRQAFEKVRQIIEKLGRIFYVGEKDGSANTIKLA